MAKALGSEIKAFWDAWPCGDDWYHDDVNVEVYTYNQDGSDRFMLDPAEKYDLGDFGILCWQGKGADPSHGDGVTFQAWFTKWQKARKTKTTTLLLTVPKGDADAVRAYAKERGWKVSS